MREGVFPELGTVTDDMILEAAAFANRVLGFKDDPEYEIATVRQAFRRREQPSGAWFCWFCIVLGYLGCMAAKA